MQQSPSDGPPNPRTGPATSEHSPASTRRSFFVASAGALAGVGLVGVGGASAAANTTRGQDIAAARGRGDGATVAQLSSATSLRVLWRANTVTKVMALTFDDGPGSRLTAPLLEVLREERVRATFSLVGKRAHQYQDLVRAEMRSGHELANHSWSHADLSLLTYDGLKPELERTDQLLYELSGRRPAVIRPPYGRLNGGLLQYAARADQGILLWDLRFQESALDSAGNAAYVLDQMRPGSVLLGHDAGSANRYVGTQAVPAIIKEAKQRGYTFLTASEMFEVDQQTVRNRNQTT